MYENTSSMTKKIFRFLGHFIRVLIRVLAKVLKQAAGAVIFALLAALELGDWTSLLSRYGNPEKDAATLGMTTQATTSHLLVLIVLSITIVLAALITVMGFFQDSKWIIRTSQITGSLFAIYGAYQAYAAIALANKGKEGLIMVGAVYLLIGIAVFGLGGKFVHTPKPAQTQVSRR